MTRTIPRTRRRPRVKQDPPLYEELVNSMAFDPGAVPDTEFAPWGLDETYPPTVSELVRTYTAIVSPTLGMPIITEQTDD